MSKLVSSVSWLLKLFFASLCRIWKLFQSFWNIWRSANCFLLFLSVFSGFKIAWNHNFPLKFRVSSRTLNYTLKFQWIFHKCKLSFLHFLPFIKLTQFTFFPFPFLIFLLPLIKLTMELNEISFRFNKRFSFDVLQNANPLREVTLSALINSLTQLFTSTFRLIKPLHFHSFFFNYSFTACNPCLWHSLDAKPFDVIYITVAIVLHVSPPRLTKNYDGGNETMQLEIGQRETSVIQWKLRHRLHLSKAI